MCIILLYGYGRLRDQHSFPTRRSSDLSAKVTSLELMQSSSFFVRYHMPAPSDGVLSVAGIDRKSTRLNSSHMSISYAVFCLKKKTDDRTNRLRLRRFGSSLAT